jgi:importin subunit alpha-1
MLVTMAVEAELETGKEAIWAVSNMFTGGTDCCVSLLVNQKGIDARMVAVLDDTREQRVTLVALDAIGTILAVGERTYYSYNILLDECGGIEKLELLQQHTDNTVYEKALNIVERFFGEEEADDENKFRARRVEERVAETIAWSPC